MKLEIDAKHVTLRGAVFHFERRVPKRFESLVGARSVRKSLRTTDPDEARKRAAEFDRFLEARWEALLAGEQSHKGDDRFEAAATLTEQAGFTFQSSEVLLSDTTELARRALALSPDPKPIEAEALMGVVERPVLTLSAALEYYFEQTEHERLQKSPTQRRIIINGRRKVVKALIEAVGDKDIAELTREDLLSHRDALRSRVLSGDLKADSVNKDLGQLRVVLRTVCELKGMTPPPMESLALKASKKRKGENREVLPFENDWIQHRFLAPGALDGLNDEARRVVYAMVETGMRPSEVVNILPENIMLDAEIPHVRIAITELRDVKTMSSERRIPLVGVSLKAFQAQRDGFPRYFDKNPQLSAVVNKFLKSQGLLPSAKHRLYSLRHAFEDRLIAAGMDYRVRKELMGHQVHDMTYGVGASLAQIREVLEKIAFSAPNEV